MLEPRIVATSVSRLIDADRPRWADEFVPALLACGPAWVVVRRLIAPACSDGRRSAISNRAAPHHSSVLLEATAALVVAAAADEPSPSPSGTRRRPNEQLWPAAASFYRPCLLWPYPLHHASHQPNLILHLGRGRRAGRGLAGRLRRRVEHLVELRQDLGRPHRDRRRRD